MAETGAVPVNFSIPDVSGVRVDRCAWADTLCRDRGEAHEVGFAYF